MLVQHIRALYATPMKIMQLRDTEQRSFYKTPFDREAKKVGKSTDFNTTQTWVAIF